ncbi:MAG: alkane 1-monooxygenase [Thermoanaerobaculia bacterium]|nr:alkane 1-monooxygenase [Thermoanaerobaculia bacterium]
MPYHSCMLPEVLNLDDPTGVARPLGALPFFVAYLIPASAIVAIAGEGGWVLSTVVLVFVITPVLDLVLGNNRRNPRWEAKGPPPRRDAVFDLALWLWVPLQVFILGWAIWTAGAGSLRGWELAGLALSVGISTGSGAINVAHELMHRTGRLERALAEILMVTALYPHFCIEHTRGHHRTVATPEDPASARFGESLYGFLPRTIFGSLVSAWRLERERIERSGRRARGLGDRRIRYPLVLAAAIVAIAFLAGWRGLLFYVGQGLVAILLLEIINYIEHYGLERRRLDSGRWERVGPRHSWNASQRLTNWYLFNLQRHADHHEYASRPYWLLRHVPESPQLPAGYATMSLTALVPPLWRRIMDPRVRQIRQPAGD